MSKVLAKENKVHLRFFTQNLLESLDSSTNNYSFVPYNPHWFVPVANHHLCLRQY